MKNSLLTHLDSRVLGTILLLVSLVFSACTENTRNSQTYARIKADGVEHGGLFRMNIPEEVSSFFPHNVVDANAGHLINQVYEGLLSLDQKTHKIIPCLAESYTISEDGLVYTFNIRKGVYFHDDPIFKNGKGRELKAEDVAFCFNRLCEPSPRNQKYSFVIDLIKGAREHFESGETGGNVEGIRVINDYVLEIELAHPSPIFSSILTHSSSWIFPRELYEYGDDMDVWCIGTGPFQVRTIKMNEVVILERNKKYWRKDTNGNTIPYIDAIRCNFMENENRQLEMLIQGNLDLVLKVPYKYVTQIMQENGFNEDELSFTVQAIPGLHVEFYGFQHRDDLFSDLKVRKAFNYAINKQFLVDSILMGYGEPAVHGFVPSAMPGYHYDEILGYPYNPRMARELFAEAGYENGDGFPVLTLQVNDGSSANIEVADAVQKMLTENLNITLEIAVLPRSLHYDQVENGDALFWRDGWMADYADPENFLRLFYGKLVPEDTVKASYLNTMRFKSTEFDEKFEKSLRERNDQKRFEEYVKADRIIVEEAAVVPLYYVEQIWLIDKHVENLTFSGVGMLDLSEVHFSNRESILQKDLEAPQSSLTETKTNAEEDSILPQVKRSQNGEFGDENL